MSVEAASDLDRFNALAKLVAEKARTVATKSDARVTAEGKKRVYYFSIEFLIGRLLDNYLLNFGVRDMVAEALDDMGFDLSVIENQEPDPALGNGGLGRLAACFLDSMAAEGIAGYGNGMRYRYGLFKQEIVNGSQVEATDEWLTHGYPWEVRRQDKAVTIKFGGHVEGFEENGRTFYRTVDTQDILAVPYDIPVVGYAGETVNKLRVWAAEPVEEHFDLEAFNRGDYALADAERAEAEAISAILYPNDAGEHGRLLRLKQEYLFVSAGIYSLLDTFEKEHGENWELLPQFVAIHTNDTHPAMCGPELMRILLDECGYSWDDAWAVVTEVFAYTNHTVMSEALECWSEDLFRRLLPRIYQIVKEIDNRFRSSVWEQTHDAGKVERMAIISNGVVRMANLCVACCHSVNGVSALHSEILKDSVFHDFYTLTPDKFCNVTNGIAHRRWLCQSNPRLTSMLNDLIGGDFVYNAECLSELAKYKDNPAVLAEIEKIKTANKADFAKRVKAKTGIELDPNSIFDVQVKRLHEYKRQLMNALSIVDIYFRLKNGELPNFQPTVYIFGAKAAPGYYMAKQMIRMICKLGDLINNDPAVRDKLRVVYLEEYCVSLSEHLMPAAEVSEQISLAGTEASGTGNMKFMLNGAITLGTLDGANVEIADAAGKENELIFGMLTPEVNNLKQVGYHPNAFITGDDVANAALNFLERGWNGENFHEVTENLRSSDPYMVMADFKDYRRAQADLQKLYADRETWARMSLKNIANSGIFSADRAVLDYARDIWYASPVPMGK